MHIQQVTAVWARIWSHCRSFPAGTDDIISRNRPITRSEMLLDPREKIAASQPRSAVVCSAVYSVEPLLPLSFLLLLLVTFLFSLNLPTTETLLTPILSASLQQDTFSLEIKF
jgi:hypothetical protein